MNETSINDLNNNEINNSDINNKDLVSEIISEYSNTNKENFNIQESQKNINSTINSNTLNLSNNIDKNINSNINTSTNNNITTNNTKIQNTINIKLVKDTIVSLLIFILFSNQYTEDFISKLCSKFTTNHNIIIIIKFLFFSIFYYLYRNYYGS